MDETEEQKNIISNIPKDPGQDLTSGVGFFAPKAISEPDAVSEDFLSLAEAGKVTGYHQDYLGFLCRTGKLKGFKIGRNWVTTNSALEEFLKNYKNGVSEITDESGRKIQVHVENVRQQVSPVSQNAKLHTPSTLNQKPAPAVLASSQISTNSVSQSPDQILQLTKLKREIFNELENRIESLNLNLSKLENKVAGAKTTEAVLEEKGVKDKNALAEKVYILPPTVSPRFERNELSEKFISNFSLDKLSEDFNAAPVVAQTKFALTKEKVKDLYKSFAVPQQKNLPVVFASLAIALLGLVGSLLWSNISTQTQVSQKPDVTKYVYEQKANSIEHIADSEQNGTTIVNNNIANQVINKVLGLSESQVYSFIDQRLNKYLAEGKFKGDKGETGATGISGTSGGVSTITYIQPNPSTGNGGGSMLGITYLSSQNFTTNNASVNNLLTVSGTSNFTGAVTMSGPTTLNGTTTIASLNVTNINPNFTAGSVVFQGASGLAQDNGNFFYDQTNKRFGIGT
ncbi:MAG: helix-turn-helix domain-containing protein, partial [Patescibacteria group bacterium]